MFLGLPSHPNTTCILHRVAKRTSSTVWCPSLKSCNAPHCPQHKIHISLLHSLQDSSCLRMVKYLHCPLHVNRAGLFLVPNHLRAFENAVTATWDTFTLFFPYYWFPLNFQASTVMSSLHRSLLWSSSSPYHLTCWVSLCPTGVEAPWRKVSCVFSSLCP